MLDFNKPLRSFSSRILTFIPLHVLRKVEDKVQRLQGKGWGAGTVRFEVEAVLSLFPETLINKDQIVIFDVGANVGNWTDAIIEKNLKISVHCFEPSQHAYSLLQNKFQDYNNVILNNFALGAESTQGLLWADTPGSGLASIYRRNLKHFKKEMNYSEKVKINTLDNYINENNVQPDILKIDVEGNELAVLQGGLHNIEKCKVIQFEFGGCNIDSRTYFQDFYYFFLDAGFEIYRLSERGLLKLDSYSELDENFRVTNYFAKKI